MLWLLFTLIPSLICVLVAICGNFQLYKSRNNMFMKKRKMIFGVNIALIVGLLSTVCSHYGIISSDETILMFSIVSFFAVWFAIFYALNVRTFMIFFKHKWQFYRLELKWQNVINSNYGEVVSERNWYLHNNKKFGNARFIKTIFGITHFICFCICIVGEWMHIDSNSNHHNNNIHQLIAILSIITFLLPVLIYIIILHSIDIPVIDDIFFIDWGSKIHSKISILLVIDYCIQNILLTIIKPIPLIPIIIVLSIRSILLFSMVFVSTFMLMHKNKNDHQMNIQIQSQYTCSESDGKQNANQHYVDLKLKDILSNKYAVHLFMVHLFNEFSFECLVSYIEFTQFQQYLLAKMDDKSQMDDIILIDFPDNIPLSAIIESDETAARDDNDGPVAIKSAKIKAHKLYNKYVRVGCEHEINISSKMRSRLTQILHDKQSLLEYNSDLKMNMNDLVKLFNAVKNVMFLLMEYSFSRFKQQHQYEKILQIFEKLQIKKLDITLARVLIFK